MSVVNDDKSVADCDRRLIDPTQLAPPAQAAEWTIDANRIRALLAC
jgi:hypothetical protein